MLFRNGLIENATEGVDIRVLDGKFAAIAPNLEPLPGEEIIDCTGKLILPPFIESHIHLDTCLTAGQPSWNMSGTLFEGIERWEERKQFLTKEDVRSRVKRCSICRLLTVFSMSVPCGHQRPKVYRTGSHSGTQGGSKSFINIQIVAFPQHGILSYPKGRELLEEALKMGADAVGAIPHFEFTREYSVESLNICFELAQKYGKLIDVHCDEIDDEASRGLETLAARAYETGMRDMVTASHTTAMHSYNNAYVNRLMRLLKMSGINFVANPCVNVHLGGRVDNYPKRRAMTRVKELVAEGINVSFGNDDIFDPWNPMGNAGMRDAVFMGLYVGHMLGYEEIMKSYKFVTYNAARTLHLGDAYGIKEGNSASFVIMDAKNYYEVLKDNATVLASYKDGKLIARTEPAKTQVFVPGE